MPLYLRNVRRFWLILTARTHYASMLKYLRNYPQTEFVFVFSLRGLPISDFVEYWLIKEGDGSCFAWKKVVTHIIRHDRKKGENSSVVERQAFPRVKVPHAISARLTNLLDAHRFREMRNYYGDCRDGIHYNVSFANKEWEKDLRIWNPEEKTTIYEFIGEIQGLLKECNFLPNRDGNACHEK